MNVNVRLFARYRELAGASTLSLDLPAKSTAIQAFDRVADRYPQMRAMRGSTLMARRLRAGCDGLAGLQPLDIGLDSGHRSSARPADVHDLKVATRNQLVDVLRPMPRTRAASGA